MSERPKIPTLALSRPAPGVAQMTIVSEPLGVLRTEVKRAIEGMLRDLEAQTDVRALILTGQGRAFSVGSDVREFQQDADWLRTTASLEQRLFSAIEESRLPVIAACNGLTLGGGAELALTCDIRIAAESARFGYPEVRVGTFASAGGTQRLPLHVGLGTARYLLMTGRILSSSEALALRLVQEVVADGELSVHAIELARELAFLPAAGLQATKRCINEGILRGRAAGRSLEDDLTVELGLSPDAAEGQAAFLEKRPPRFGRGAR